MMLVEVESRRYRVLHPRPVYIIIVEHDGRVNAMAASWVTPISEEPERMAVAIDKESYTYELLRKSQEFTVNVVDENLVDTVWCVGTRSGREVDKVAECSLELEESRRVKAPHLKNAIGVIEARVYRVIEDVAEDTALVVADILAAYARSDLFNPRYGWELTKARILLHSSGRAFTTIHRLILPKSR